jgi:hypothetical protein
VSRESVEGKCILFVYTIYYVQSFKTDKFNEIASPNENFLLVSVFVNPVFTVKNKKSAINKAIIFLSIFVPPGKS